MRVSALVLIVVATLVTVASALAPIRQLHLQQQQLVVADLADEVQQSDDAAAVVEADDAEAELVEAVDVDAQSFVDVEGDGHKKGTKKPGGGAKKPPKNGGGGAKKPPKNGGGAKKPPQNGGGGAKKPPAGTSGATKPPTTPPAAGGTPGKSGGATPSSPAKPQDKFNKKMEKKIAARTPPDQLAKPQPGETPEQKTIREARLKEWQAKKDVMLQAAKDGKLSNTKVDKKLTQQASAAQKAYRRKVQERSDRMYSQARKSQLAECAKRNCSKAEKQKIIDDIRAKQEATNERIRTSHVDHRIEKQLGGDPIDQANLKMLYGPTNSQAGSHNRADKNAANEEIAKGVFF